MQGDLPAAFQAVGDALDAGYDDFTRLHDHSALKKLRQRPEFKDLVMPFVCQRCRRYRRYARAEFDGVRIEVCKLCVTETAIFRQIASTATMCMRQNKYEAAETYFGQMLAASPGHKATLYSLAVARLRQNNERGALDAIDELLFSGFKDFKRLKKEKEFASIKKQVKVLVKKYK